MPVDRPADPTRRSARRAFIRANHPDLGGDPAVFVAGLAAYDRLRRGIRDRAGSGDLVFYRRPRGAGRITAGFRRWLERRRRPPRVQ